MENKIQNLVLGISLLCIAISCSTDVQYLQVEGLNTQASKNGQGYYTHIDNSIILYNPHNDSYVRKQNDPFAIENVREAYNNLIKKNICSNELEIKATHYALRLYPKNSMELWELENMEGINISYIPFDYEYCNEENIEGKISNVSFEKSPYIVKDKSISDDIDTLSEISYNLPILYVAWPKEKNFPEKYEYKIDYEIFNPFFIDSSNTKNTSLSPLSNKSDINKIVQESIKIALGESKIKSQSIDTFYNGIAGKFYYKDYTLNTTPHLHNVKIRLKLGSVSWETYTASDGTFNFRGDIPKEATYSMIFNHPKWRITGSEESNEPLTYTYGTVGEIWGDSNYLRTAYKLSSRPLFEAHSAVNYFFTSNHEIPKYTITPGVRIVVSKDSLAKYNGEFKRTTEHVPYIIIYNKNRDKTIKVISTVLHELGHYTTFEHFNNITNYANYPRLLKESWAVYTGWYLTKKFYERYNYTETDGITSFARNYQTWKQTKPDTAYYSPLFIDLVDSYNQNSYHSSYNNDPITGVPHSVIINVGLNSQTWNSLKTKLNSYVGTYYSNTELTTFLEPYENWKNINNVTM